MNFDAVIFDLDGTLANTLEDIADSMNHVLAAMGFSVHGYDAYRFYVGSGLRNLVFRSLPAYARTNAIITDCHDRMVTEYSTRCLCKTRLYDGIPDLLDALSQRSVRLATLSNKADALTQTICNDLLKRWKFDIVLGATERFPRKPDPASAWFVAGQIGVVPSQVCYLGDSDVDMKTATAAGFYPVGAGWGFRPVEELVENGAKRIVHHPMELMKILLSDPS